MTHEFQLYGPDLIEQGYLITPIVPGKKRPAIADWQNTHLTAAAFAQIRSQHTGGVGILCGQGEYPMSAIDVDTLHPGLAARFVEWCERHLGLTVTRVGKAPKILLVYRAAEAGWPKAASAWFEDAEGGKHRLEVLGCGQQFVAYAEHPDTGRPYEWTDLFGGLAELPAVDLPILTAERVNDALEAFAALAVEAGLTRKVGTERAATAAGAGGLDALETYEPPMGLSETDLQAAMREWDVDNYDEWLTVGMALHHETSGSPNGLDLWNEWSAEGASYSGRSDLAYRWDGFGKASGRRAVTFRTIVKRARERREDKERDARRAARETMQAQITACEDPTELLAKVARGAGRATEGDPALRLEFEGLLQTRFQELTGRRPPIADVRHAMSTAPDTVKAAPSGRSLRNKTEFGNAERMLDRFGAGLRYVPELEQWLAWTGVYWRRACITEIMHLAKETIRALPEEIAAYADKDDELRAFYTFCAVSQKAAMVNNMVALAASDPRVVVNADRLDANLDLLGVGNGAVDLRTGYLLEPNRDHHITLATAVCYDPAAAAPLWEQTVSDVFFNDSEMVGFFQRLVGYALLGRPDEDVLVIPHGTGSNGKSTVLGLIREVLGPHAKAASADTFVQARGGGPSGGAGGAREDVLRLRGARFVYASEPEEGSELRENMIKSMTGGDPIPARGLYARATVEVVPTWVAFMPTNHKPIVKGDDHGIWRRLLLVPFTRNFSTDATVEKDVKRAEKLRAEMPGILRWCVEGALAYRREGLNPPAAVRAAREAYKDDMDLLSDWLAECCEIGPDKVAANDALWRSWEAWARDRGELQFIRSAKSLGRRLGQRFRQVRDCAGVRGRGFVGLAVRSVGDF